MVSFDEIIPPGKEGKVSAKVKTTGYKNQLTRTVTLQTNDPLQSSYVLKIKMNIKSVLFIQPADRVSWNAQVHRTDKKLFFISSADDPDFEVTEVLTRRKDMQTTVTKAPEGKCTSQPCYQLTVTFTPDKATNRYNERLTVSTNSKREPQTFISLYGRIGGNINYMPNRLTLNSQKSSNNGLVSATINLTGANGKLEIIDVSTNDPRLKTTLHTVEKNTSYVLTAIWNSPDMLEKKLNPSITITTNDNAQKNITIPVLIYRK